MGNYFINELVGRRLLSIVIKSVLGGAAVHYQMKQVQVVDVEVKFGYQVAMGVMIFLLIYMLCSLFQLCLSITQNYIIGFITTIAALLGGVYLLTIVEGGRASWLALLGMLAAFIGPVIVDVWKLIVLIRMKE